MSAAAAPLVSVVTPSLDQGAFLAATIESVRAQVYPHVEHLVVDGGSTDGTLEILQRYPHLRWTSGPDAGQADAVNAGWQRAGGEILGWLNADDVYEPGAIAAAVAALTAHPAADGVYGDCHEIDAAGRWLRTRPSRPFDLGALLCLEYDIYQPTVFLRRRVLERVGWLDPRLHLAMDFDYWTRVGRGWPQQAAPLLPLAAPADRPRAPQAQQAAGEECLRAPGTQQAARAERPRASGAQQAAPGAQQAVAGAYPAAPLLYVPQVWARFRVHADAKSSTRARAILPEHLHTLQRAFADPALPPALRARRREALSNAFLSGAERSLAAGARAEARARLGWALRLSPHALRPRALKAALLLLDTLAPGGMGNRAVTGLRLVKQRVLNVG